MTFRAQLVEVRVVREDAHLAALAEDVGQVVHVVRLEDFVLLSDFFCGHTQESRQVDLGKIERGISHGNYTYLFTTAFEEALVEAELVKVHILKHMVDLVIRLAKGL